MTRGRPPGEEDREIRTRPLRASRIDDREATRRETPSEESPGGRASECCGRVGGGGKPVPPEAGGVSEGFPPPPSAVHNHFEHASRGGGL